MSDRAAACIGCGAPLTAQVAFNSVPTPSTRPPPSRSRLVHRAILCSLALILGVVGASLAERFSGGSRIPATLAALLVIVGLCGILVTATQLVLLRK